LGAFVSDAADLLERLGSQTRATQREACDEAVKRLREEPGLREHVRNLLHGPNAIARFSAAWVLFHVERPTLRLLPALLDALELRDGDLRWQAAQMLTTLGRLQPEVLPVVLHEATAAGSAARRRMAIFVLRELAPEREETAAAYLRALDDGDGDVRRAALSCFAKLTDPPRALAVRALELARGVDPDPRMARIATVVLPSLASFHPDLRDEISAALDALEHAADPSLVRGAQAARLRLADTDA
jgi:HEAT repeat protein